jgi:hypothetical protein
MCGGGVNACPSLDALPTSRGLFHCSVSCEQIFSVAAKWLSLFCCFLAAVGCDGRNAGRGRGRELSALAAQTSQTHFLLDANPARINMGTVAQGGRKQATFTLTNPGNRTIDLAKIDTSCPCLTVDVPLRIPPSDKVEGRAKLDLSDEPNFTGEVAIEIKGWTSGGEPAFLVVAAVRVPRKNER